MGAKLCDPRIFLYILIQNPAFGMVHSLAPKMGSISVYQDACALGKMKTVGRDCRMRPEGPKIEDEGRERVGSWEGQQVPPARGSGSDQD